MGIPRFTARLRHRAEREPLSMACEDQIAIIDGPSLAYYIYHMVCAPSTRSHGGFPKQSYAAYGKQAVTWLDDLQSRGLKV